MTLRQREPREKNERYLAYIRTLPCLCCGAIKVDAAHIRTASISHGKRGTGMGEKPDDRWCLPLCRVHHHEQHNAGSEVLFWRHYKLDPFAIAMRLWTAWKAMTGYVKQAPRRPAKRDRKPKPQRAKSAWPKRQMKSRNTFNRQERT